MSKLILLVLSQVKQFLHILYNLSKIIYEETTILLVEQNTRQALDVAVRGYVLRTGMVGIAHLTSCWVLF
ncbi:MAG: hypothetical protein KME29_23050 [Calothrix sp. FI2-JRJ7]|nr:hypothetical protein [Calothrix sp. FI2-JRJ7]